MYILINELSKRGFSYKSTAAGAKLRYDGIAIPVNRNQARHMDASSRLAFGLCAEYGIDLPNGAEPADAWEALKEVTGKSAEDFYNNSGEKGNSKVRFGNTKPKKFAQRLAEAKEAQKPEDQWRVTGMTKEEFQQEHPDAKFHVTDGGSTVAVDKGDIVAVCKNPKDNIRGKALLAFAVKNGGTKLDSYDGNHQFYANNGFEPVSWCEWDPAYAPPGWKESGSKPENIIFYKYTGKPAKYLTPQDFYKAVPKSSDYMAAQADRDSKM